MSLTSVLADLNFGLFAAGAPNYSLHALPVVLFFAALRACRAACAVPARAPC